MLKEILTITILIFNIMLIQEYLLTRFPIYNTLIDNLYKQNKFISKILIYTISILLGLLPGCVGSFFVANLFIHNQITIGTMIANFIATIGDDGFFLLANSLTDFIKLYTFILPISLISAIIVDLIFKTNTKITPTCYKIQDNQTDKVLITTRQYLNQGSRFKIAKLAIIIAMVIILMFFKLYKNLFFIITTTVSFFILLKADKEFTINKIIYHIIMKHLVKIVVLISAALLFYTLIINIVELKKLKNAAQYLAFISAILPASGLNILTIIAYLKQILPFKYLLINSIIQNGHASLLILSSNLKKFLKIKAILITIALVVFIIASL